MLDLVVDVDPKELEPLNLLHRSPVDENGGVLSPLLPVVHNHFLCLDHVEGEVVVLAPHGQVSDLLAIGCLVVVATHNTFQVLCNMNTSVIVSTFSKL